MTKEPKKHTVCRNCGGRTFISEYSPQPIKAQFDHIVVKCRTCGAWCGGFTKKAKKTNK